MSHDRYIHPFSFFSFLFQYTRNVLFSNVLLHNHSFVRYLSYSPHFHHRQIYSSAIRWNGVECLTKRQSILTLVLTFKTTWILECNRAWIECSVNFRNKPSTSSSSFQIKSFRRIFIASEKKMGKTRKPRYRVKKPNQVGIPSLRDIDLDDELNREMENGRHPEGALSVIREQLQSSNTEEKMCGLQSMAFLSLNPKKAVAMCESDIIRIAAPLLVDQNKNIRNAVAGAIRNVSICGIDICENLVEQDVLTPLLSLINEYTNNVNWLPNIDRSISHLEQLDIVGDTFLQAVNLVWNLCESTSVALQHFNQTNILESFIRFLNYTAFGMDICKLLLIIINVGEKHLPYLTHVITLFQL